MSLWSEAPDHGAKKAARRGLKNQTGRVTDRAAHRGDANSTLSDDHAAIPGVSRHVVLPCRVRRSRPREVSQDTTATPWNCSSFLARAIALPVSGAVRQGGDEHRLELTGIPAEAVA